MKLFVVYLLICGLVVPAMVGMFIHREQKYKKQSKELNTVIKRKEELETAEIQRIMDGKE